VSTYRLSDEPGFPAIRWHRREDGLFVAEWEVTYDGDGPLPLALVPEPDVEIRIARLAPQRIRVSLTARMKPIRPEVYSVFYRLIRPAFDDGRLVEIEGGDLPGGTPT